MRRKSCLADCGKKSACSRSGGGAFLQGGQGLSGRREGSEAREAAHDTRNELGAGGMCSLWCGRRGSGMEMCGGGSAESGFASGETADLTLPG